MAEWIEIRKVKSVLPGTRVSASDGGVDEIQRTKRSRVYHYVSASDGGVD